MAYQNSSTERDNVTHGVQDWGGDGRIIGVMSSPHLAGQLWQGEVEISRIENRIAKSQFTHLVRACGTQQVIGKISTSTIQGEAWRGVVRLLPAPVD